MAPSLNHSAARRSCDLLRLDPEVPFSHQRGLLNRACDPCAARKSRCDRQFPCQRCKTLSITCVTVRRHSKSGPKGPWARKKLLARALEGRRQGPGRDTGSLSTLNDEPAAVNVPSLLPQRLHTTSIIPITLIRRYLDIYQQELYPIWPVVNTDGLLLRLEDSNDTEAYSLATSLCAVTIAQLNVLPEGSSGLLVVDSSKMALESERARRAIDYQERPSISILLSSFFLHIAVANRGQINKATLLLREAITFAQLLGLDKAEHYLILCNQDAQLQLRIAWLLFITERGHTTRFELPRILQLDSTLPELEIDENPAILSAFVGMCNLFRDFGVAMDGVRLGQTEEFYVAMHMRLRETLELPQHCSNLQKADFFITQQWMRVVLWKKSLFYIELMINPADDGLSLSLPDSIARRVVSCLNTFPMPIVEAHGLGMEMKLFEVAISLADILLCQPSVSPSRQLMQVGPRDILNQFVQYLSSFRGGDGIKLQILQQKMHDTFSRITLVPGPPEVEEESATIVEEKG